MYLPGRAANYAVISADRRGDHVRQPGMRGGLLQGHRDGDLIEVFPTRSADMRLVDRSASICSTNEA